MYESPSVTATFDSEALLGEAFGIVAVGYHRLDLAVISESRDLVQMQPDVVAHHQDSYFFNHRNRAERSGEDSQRPRRIGDLGNLVVAQHQRSALAAMVEDENGAAVFLAQLQLAVRDPKESVALIEYRPPRVSDRPRALLGLGVIRQTELCFQVLH